jgi:hypothetical protein
MAILLKTIIADSTMDIPQTENWDKEIEENPWPSGGLKIINGELVYVWEHT